MSGQATAPDLGTGRLLHALCLNGLPHAYGVVAQYRRGRRRGPGLGARAFGKAIWDAVGERKNPKIVFEHPGESTLPTSGFVCDLGGMIVICAGTTGYNVTLDLRYHWMMQKRFQGSHLANDQQATALNELVASGKVDPCLSDTYSFDEIGHAHQLMHENKHPYGNMACLVNATQTGLGAK